jgi:hypothetical protein
MKLHLRRFGNGFLFTSLPFLVAAFFIAGCATPPVLEATGASDSLLSCPELQAQYNAVQRVSINADREKGLTQGNLLRAVLFWPSIIGTASNANEAIAAADKRLKVLEGIMQPKQCAVPEGPAGASAKSPLPFFKGVVLERRDIAASETMTPLPMRGGGFITVPTGSRASSIITVRDSQGQTRRLVSPVKFEVGSCVEVMGPNTLPRGLLDFEAGEVNAQATESCN